MNAISGGNSVVVVVAVDLENLIPTCSNRCGHGRCADVVVAGQ